MDRAVSSEKRETLRKIELWAAKTVVAFVAAFAVLHVFGLFYYNLPGSQDTTTGATDVIRKPNYFYCSMSEGFGYGRIDKNGYTNSSDMAERDRCDVLILGSSHMAGLQVPQDKTTARVLDGLLDDMAVYNMGMTAHYLLRCAQNLRDAITQVKPTKYVIIETRRLIYDDEEVQQVLSNDLPRVIVSARNDKPQKNIIMGTPYMRWLSVQRGNSRYFQKMKKSPEKFLPAPILSYALTAEMIDRMRRIAEENHVTLIILHHARMVLNEDGSAAAEDNPDEVRDFAAACSAAGVVFVNMTDVFLQAYADEHILPHGFANTQIGTGHLNADGHRMIAEELARVIRELEQSRAGRESETGDHE